MHDIPEIERRLEDGSEPFSAQELFERFEGLGIDYKVVTHAPLFTVEQSKELRGELPGGHTKNLFLRNKKGAMWLVTCPEDRQIDLKALGDQLGSGRLSFGKPERLMRFLGVRPGAVTPLAVINDRLKQVELVIDSAVLQHDPVNVHPLTNDMTVALSPRDLLRFLEAVEHPPRLLELA
ncbi:MAG TPA: prolyl-tRNA synthetase associated domain-containing protein [Kiloniellales bacterium]|nr:prolyl-tRNA synthetase associated domain-containing protein [Kiloniellales bacterium]